MKYVPPLGSADPNASYQDGNPEAGILGSIVPAAAIERPQREILNVLTAAGLTPSDTDLTQLLAAIRKIIGIQNAELERLRLLKIGCPMYWRSTTLPEGFAWVNGDLVRFEDWPEFAAVYNAGGFSGMVLEANATSEQIAANLGKFRKHPNGLGLYLPSCGDQFFRAWVQGTGREAGSWRGDAIRNIAGAACFGFDSSQGTSMSGPFHAFAFDSSVNNISGGNLKGYRSDMDVSRVVPTGPVTVPPHVCQPVIVYLGLHA